LLLKRPPQRAAFLCARLRYSKGAQGMRTALERSGSLAGLNAAGASRPTGIGEAASMRGLEDNPVRSATCWLKRPPQRVAFLCARPGNSHGAAGMRTSAAAKRKGGPHSPLCGRNSGCLSALILTPANAVAANRSATIFCSHRRSFGPFPPRRRSAPPLSAG